jgi:flagellar biosynthesis protein FlhB
VTASLPPSAERRREARAAGRVPVTPLGSAAAALAAGGLFAWATGASGAGRIVALARRAWGGELDVLAAVGELLPAVMRVALPVALGAWLAALAVGAAQTRGLFTLGAFRRPAPKGDDDAGALQPVAWALAAGLIALALLAARSTARDLASAEGIAGAAAVVVGGVRALVPRALMLVAAAALGDWAWRRLRHERALLMTRAEVERERREEAGDPRLRAERRRRHRATLAEPRRPPPDDKT